MTTNTSRPNVFTMIFELPLDWHEAHFGGRKLTSVHCSTPAATKRFLNKALRACLDSAQGHLSMAQEAITRTDAAHMLALAGRYIAVAREIDKLLK